MWPFLFMDKDVIRSHKTYLIKTIPISHKLMHTPYMRTEVMIGLPGR